MQAIAAIDRIIWSADVGTLAELMIFLRKMPMLQHVKIDRLFATANGLDVIGLLAEMGIRVFADGKIVEIPSKAVAITELHLKQGPPWMLNCMAGICSTGVLESPDKPDLVDGLKRFADACHKVGTLPCGVTVLTSKTPEVVAREFNRALDPDNKGQVCTDQVLEYVGMLQEFGFTDVVCSPREVGAIRAESAFDNLSLNTPGVRMPGSDAADQARTDTPGNAVRAGATRLVIGRDITNAEDPAAALDRIMAHLEETALAA